MTPQVYVNGRALASLAPVSGLRIVHEWPAAGIGGPVGASFQMVLDPRAARPDWIQQGVPATVQLGPKTLLSGKFAEPDWVGGSMSITAASQEGTQVACLTAGGETTSTPDVAVDQGIARGALTWSRPGSISNTALASTDATASLNSVTDLLAAYADASGARLYVDELRNLRAGTDPTAPTVFLLPSAGELAWTLDRQATTVIGRYKDAAGVLHNATAGSGPVEQLVDLTPKGPLTPTQANTLVAAILAKATSGGWTGGLTVSPVQIVGSPNLAVIAAAVGHGLMARLDGRQDPRSGRLPTNYTDVVIERSDWDVAANQIMLTPRGMVARDFAAVLAEFGVAAG